MIHHIKATSRGCLPSTAPSQTNDMLGSSTMTDVQRVAQPSDRPGLEPAGVLRTVRFKNQKRLRAGHACLHCRARKVRCNVAIHGAPCTNCRLDQHDCTTIPSRKIKSVQYQDRTSMTCAYEIAGRILKDPALYCIRPCRPSNQYIAGRPAMRIQPRTRHLSRHETSTNLEMCIPRAEEVRRARTVGSCVSVSRRKVTSHAC